MDIQKRAGEYWSGENKFKYKQFYIIAWKLIERVINRKLQIYKVWYTKQHSGWCTYGKI